MEHPRFGVDDNPPELYTPEGYPPKAPASRGCFFYGCLFAAILGVLGVLAAGGLAYLAYRSYANLVRDYTATSPAPLPPVEMPEDQRKALDERWAAFRKALDDGKPAEIELNADELNVLVSQSPKLKGRVHFTLKGDQATADVSIPLEGLPMGSGRYLNGSATLTGSIRDGDLVVRATDMVVNGKPLPPNIKSQLAGQNLAKDFSKDPENAEKLRKIESFEIKDGKIRIKSRDMHAEEDASPPAGDDRKPANSPPPEEVPKAEPAPAGKAD
jgi:hypothetical protein